MSIRAWVLVLLGCSALGAAWAEVQSQPRLLLRVRASGRDVPVASAEDGALSAAEVPAGLLAIRLGEPAKTSRAAPQRYRYRLEGVDAGWREMRSAMRVVIVFFNEHNDWLAETPFLVQGESVGWRGDARSSPLAVRRESVAVPERAARFSVVLTSAGPPAAVGTLAVGALTVSAAGAGAPLLELAFPAAPAAEGAREAPPGWIRSGTHPSMAQVLPAERSPAGLALALVDDDPMSHAEWQSPRVPVGAAAGTELSVAWSQCHSIGLSDFTDVQYERLPAGRYVFRAQALSAAGLASGEELALPILVRPPFWQRPWFLVLCGMAAAAAALGGTRYAYWRRAQRELARLRQQSALEAERARIARDIHDDLGATLTHISMLSQPATPETASFAELADNLGRINRAAREMTQSMDEIVWAVNPKNDRLDQLVNYLDSYAQEFLASAGIEFRSDYPELVPARPVPAPARHSLFLAFKEALANAARHAACRAVRVTLSVSAGALTLSLEDDGRGFDESAASRSGNGLANMRRRLEALGGRCAVESAPGRGTQVTFELPLEE